MEKHRHQCPKCPEVVFEHDQDVVFNVPEELKIAAHTCPVCGTTTHLKYCGDKPVSHPGHGEAACNAWVPTEDEKKQMAKMSGGIPLPAIAAALEVVETDYSSDPSRCFTCGKPNPSAGVACPLCLDFYHQNRARGLMKGLKKDPTAQQVKQMMTRFVCGRMDAAILEMVLKSTLLEVFSGLIDENDAFLSLSKDGLRPEKQGVGAK